MWEHPSLVMVLQHFDSISVRGFNSLFAMVGSFFTASLTCFKFSSSSLNKFLENLEVCRA